MNGESSSMQGDSRERFSLAEWHEHFLELLLRASCVIGFIGIILYLLTASQGRFKLLGLLAYGLLVFALLFRSLPYSVRAGILLILIYAMSLIALFNYGIEGASILFLGFIAMTGLLLSARAGVYFAVGIAFVSIVAVGWTGSSFAESIRSTGVFLLVSLIIAIGLHTLQQDFIKTQADARQVLDALQEEHAHLEERVQSRTAGLTRKSEQFRATSYIARKTAEVQDLASLLDTVAKLVADQFEFYHVGILLMNETGSQAVLQAASSEGGRRMIEKGFSLSVGTQGIVGYVAAQKKPRIALDVGDSAILFNNPDLPMTRSEIAVPLIIRNRVLGVLDIQSDKPQAFGEDDVDVLETLSDQIAIAIENARLMDETQAAIMQLEALTSIRTREVWSQKLREKNRIFTYTPLGLRTGKIAQNGDKAINASIMLRGQKIGTISIARKGEATWSKLDEDLIAEIATQVGLAVDNIRLLEEATQRAKHEQTIGKLAARFSQSLDLDTLLQTAVRELGQLPDISEVSVFISQEAEQTSQPKQYTKRTSS